MKINIQNIPFKTALVSCMKAYNIDFKESKTTLNTVLKMSDVKTHKITSIDQNSGLFLKDMHLMLHFLNGVNHTIINCSLDDIVLVDNHYFFINPDKIIKLDGEIFTLEYPIQVDVFSPPELHYMEELPQNLPLTTIYYNLASILYYFLTHKIYKKISDLDFIYYSPLYYCLKRMLYINPQDRKFLYI